MRKEAIQSSAQRRFYALMLIAVILMVIAFLSSRGPTGFAEVSFIDVGQGDAACVKMPGGESLLIDGGEGDSDEEHILPFLFSRGIKSIDYVFVSHYHTDHTDGVYGIIGDIPIKKIVLPEVDDYDKDIKEKLIDAAHANDIEVLEVAAGDIIKVSDELTVKILFPDEDAFTNYEKNMNNDSMVMNLSCFNTDFLFTGDLEKIAEMAVAQNADIDADVLKVAHHGSATSSSNRFLSAVSPRYAVISAGKNNSHGHPHKEVLESLNKAKIETYRTDKNGDIIFKVNQKGLCGIEIQSK